MDLIWGKSMEEKERAKKNMNYGGEIEREKCRPFFWFRDRFRML